MFDLKNFYPLKSSTVMAESIGGVPIGCADLGGIYAGYTMMSGDNFDGPLNIVGPTNPLGRYFTSSIYSPGSRSKNGPLYYTADVDPNFPGTQNANFGIPVGITDTITQSNGNINVKTRIATSAEQTFINGRLLVGAGIHSGGYQTFTAPCIYEAYVAINTNLASTANWHPTAWLNSGSPIRATNAIEYDFPEWFQTANLQANYNAHGTVTPVSSQTNLNSNLVNSGFHLYTIVLTAADAKCYVDGTLVKTQVCDNTQLSQPFVVWLTSHTLTINLADWISSGATGGTMSMGYYRIWLPNTSLNVIAPTQQLPTLQVANGAAITYNFPSVATLYGASFAGTDFCQSIIQEEFEPGSAGEGSSTYAQFPAGLSFNSGTRVLTGTTTDKKPGRLHLSSMPYLAGGAALFASRGYIDVGPRITAIDFVLVNGTACNVNLYQVCDCGTLYYGQIITVTGLPTGLTQSGYSIVGTPTVNGTTSITIQVTNASGQTASKSVNLIVQSAADAITLDGTASSTTSTVTISTTKPRDILVLVNFTNPGSTTYVSDYVTDSAGLTWIKRGYALPASLSAFALEIWYARTNGILTNNVITPQTGTRFEVFAVNGIDTVNPFDTASPIPVATNGTSATSLSVNLTTVSANTFVFASVRSLASLGTITEPAGYTNLVASGPNQDESYQIYSSTQSAVPITYSWTGVTTDSCMVIDTLKGQA